MITYFDTSILMKLLIDDEAFGAESERIWVESECAVCAEIAYTEARAALAAMRRSKRLTASSLRVAKDELGGYDAVHLAAAIAGQVTVVASADRQLVEVARHRGFAVAEPR